MGKYMEESKGLLKCMGGKKNTAAISHCVTRMRFVLRDPGKADKATTEKLPTVKGAFTQAGQFQVIIGNVAGIYYNGFVTVSGVGGTPKDVAKDATKQNQSGLQRLMINLAGIPAPLIPAIIVGGLISGFRNIIGEIALLDGGMKTLVKLSQFWAGVNSSLWLIGGAAFHFLSMCIVWSIIRKMGTTQMFGTVPGITLVSPQLLNAYGMAGTAAMDTPVWNFSFLRMQMIGYQAQVFSAILTDFTLVHPKRFFRKICPAVIPMVMVPLRSLLLTVVITHGVLGPVGWKIGSVISDFINANPTSSFKGVFVTVFGFFHTSLVITGLHRMSSVIDLQLTTDSDGTTLWPIIVLSNIAQGFAIPVATHLQKSGAKAKEVSIPSCIPCYLGVTGPAMFGVNLKYGLPFFCVMTGSAVAAATSATFDVKANAIGVGGLPGISSIQPQYMMVLVVAMLTAIVVPFMLTVGAEKKRGTGKATGNIDSVKVETVKTAGTTYQDLKAFLIGNVVAIEDIPDPVFSEEVLGDGVAAESESSVLVIPTDGTVSVVMENSFHACGIILLDGMELLSHIGLDTVAMNGNGFTAYVKPGDQVKAGDRLIGLDIGKIKAADYSVVITMVVTNSRNRGALTWTTAARVAAGESILAEAQIRKGGP